MKPAICSVCSEAFNSKNAGDWVKFSDYDKAIVTDLSHPVGLEYFCVEHVEAARGLIDISSAEALDKLKALYQCDNKSTSSRLHKRYWWISWLGL